MSSINNDAINDALTCGICQDIVTLPVHGTCCERAKSVGPACLSCVRSYCELNKAPELGHIQEKHGVDVDAIYFYKAIMVGKYIVIHIN